MQMYKKEIYKKAIYLTESGRLFNIEREELVDLFQGSVDRFCDIAYML
jgi:hypothetical protein